MSSNFGISDRGAQQVWTQTIQGSKPGVVSSMLGSKAPGETVAKGRQAFTAYFKDQVAQLGGTVPPLQRDAFERDAQRAYDRIIGGTFNKTGKGEVSWKDAHTLFTTVDKRADDRLQTLAEKYSRSTQSWTDKMDRACSPAPRFVPLDENTSEPNTVPKSAFETAKTDAKEYFDAKIGELAALTKKEDREGLYAAAKKAWTDIEGTLQGGVDHASSEAGKDAEVPKDAVFVPDYREALRKTHTEILRTVLSLNSEFANIHPEPQITSRGGSNAGFTLIQRAPKIENLVLGGGGAKGIGTPAALNELSQYGVLRGLKNVIGTSAGALVASCIATGNSAKDIEQMMGTKIKMGDLTNSVENFDKIYQGLKLDTVVGFAAQEAVRLLDELTATSVANFVKSDRGKADIAEAVNDGTITEEQGARLQSLGKGYKSGVGRGGNMVTFEDLETLHKIAPDTFKTLTLTGWDKTTDKKALFSASETPKMPIAYAGRISMSIPYYFKTVTYKKHSYQDGGVKSNMPSEVAEKLNPNSRSLLLAFDAGGSAYTILHKKGDLETNKHSGEGYFASTSGWIKSKAIGSKDYYETDAADKQKTYEGGPDTHVVFHGDLGTLSLHASQEQQDLALQVAHLRSLEQIEARQHEGTYSKVGTVEEAFGLLSKTERAAIRKAGPPTAEKYPNQPDLLAAQRLYRLCGGKG